MQTSSQASTPVSNEDLAKALAMQCLENAAESIHMDPQALLEMPPGPRRRTMIDDISIIVVLLPGRWSSMIRSCYYVCNNEKECAQYSYGDYTYTVVVVI
jgi:hypothetical protein